MWCSQCCVDDENERYAKDVAAHAFGKTSIVTQLPASHESMGGGYTADAVQKELDSTEGQLFGGGAQPQASPQDSAQASHREWKQGSLPSLDEDPGWALPVPPASHGQGIDQGTAESTSQESAHGATRSAPREEAIAEAPAVAAPPPAETSPRISAEALLNASAEKKLAVARLLAQIDAQTSEVVQAIDGSMTARGKK